MNQKRIWADPKVRAERQAAVERFMGRPMELEPMPSQPKTKKHRKATP